ncbi:DDE-type integrase/transposase/recombinase, partial [Bacillus pseudomycoides]|uniref:DDE-type integrase/transposase/recombinase n=4 Tax=Bacillus pseudomycoides TaxID=64104 RepID=UPI00211EC544
YAVRPKRILISCICFWTDFSPWKVCPFLIFMNIFSVHNDSIFCTRTPEGIQLRQVRYLNNIVEQDHRFIKKRVRSMLGFKSFGAATSILAGVKAMHMIKKEQIDLREQSVQNQKEFIHRLFGLTA